MAKKEAKKEAEKVEETTKSAEKNQDVVENLTKEKNELNDKYLRLYSEYDNFRRRTAKEKLELSKQANISIIKDVLTVVDDFQRAIENNEKVEDEAVLREGFNLIYNKFYNILKSKGLAEIEAMGEAFDVEKHEAVTNVPVEDDKQKGKVIDVLEKGYTLGDDIVRFPKVVVGQ